MNVSAPFAFFLKQTLMFYCDSRVFLEFSLSIEILTDFFFHGEANIATFFNVEN